MPTHSSEISHDVIALCSDGYENRQNSKQSS